MLSKAYYGYRRAVLTMAIATTWDGQPVADAASVRVSWRDGVVIEVDAPYAGDAAPSAAAGRTDGLWDFEVVEVFLASAATATARYLEVELGPHGHWLGLVLDGVRRRVAHDVVIDFAARIETGRWRGRASISREEIARVMGAGWSVGAVNVYAIRGSPRRYDAAFPVPRGVFAGPDFHRLEHFAVVGDDGR